MLLRAVDARLLRSLTSNEALAETYSLELAKLITRRVCQLRAVASLDNMETLPQARLQRLNGDREGQFSVSLGRTAQMILAPAKQPVPKGENGSIDLNAITEVTILEVIEDNSTI